VNNSRVAGLFVAFGVVSAAVALPFLGIVSPPWADAAPARAPAPVVAAKPEAPPEEPTRAAAPAPRKKKRIIVWSGGGEEGACSAAAPAGQPAAAPAPRVQPVTAGPTITVRTGGG
jgi:hypothetical protein